MRTNKTTSKKWPKIRKFLNDIHLWGGLISGIVVFIVCLTGTIYTYNTELREAALSEYYNVPQSGEKMNPDEILSTVEPEVKGRVVGLKIPYAEGKSSFVLYNKAPEKGMERRQGPGSARMTDQAASDQSTDSITQQTRSSGEDVSNPIALRGSSNISKNDSIDIATATPPARPRGGRGRGPRANQLAVNPYTGAVIGDPGEVKTKTAAFMQKMFGLHRWLLLNEIEEPIIGGIENRKLGSWITGTATLLFLLGVLTGIIIWFPKKLRSWKNGLKIRWTAKWKRVNHDLHNTLGFYSFILLFLMSVTGPFWSFEWYRTGWQKAWGTYQDPNAPQVEKPKLVSEVLVGREPISIAEALAIVNDALPYKGDVTINFASDSTGTMNISKNRIGFFAPSASDRLVLDQYSGKILDKDIFREKPFNERASASIKALHIGDIYGPFTKLLYFIACLIATSLPVTGVMIWINKMKKKPKKKRTTSSPYRS